MLHTYLESSSFSSLQEYNKLSGAKSLQSRIKLIASARFVSAEKCKQSKRTKVIPKVIPDHFLAV